MTFIGEMLYKLTKHPDQGGIMYGVGSPKQREICKRIGIQLRDTLLATRRYHLGTDFTKMASMYGFNVDDPMQKIMNMAKAPFESVWIEWPVQTQLRAIGVEPAQNSPLMTGVLVRKIKGSKSQYLMTVVTTSHITDGVEIEPISILFDTENPIDRTPFKRDLEFILSCVKDFVRFETNDGTKTWENYDFDINILLDSTLMGGRMSDPTDGYTNNEGSQLVHANTRLQPDFGDMNKNRVLTKHATYCLTPKLGDEFIRRIVDPTTHPTLARNLKYIVQEHIRETSGMYRFVLSALALLNSKSYVRSDTVKPKRLNTQVNERSQAPWPPSYEFVTTKAPHTVILRDIQGNNEAEEAHIKRRQHDVEGHWMTFHKTGKDDCPHVMANLDDSGDKKICILCGRKITWRKDHKRGDPELGYKPRASRIILTE